MSSNLEQCGAVRETGKWEPLGAEHVKQLSMEVRAEYHYLCRSCGLGGDLARVMIIGKENGRDYIIRTEFIDDVIPEDTTLRARLDKKAEVCRYKK